MIRVLIVDDHTLVREGLRAVLANHPDIRVVGEAGDGVAALEAVTKHRPDVVLMDIMMPRMNGLEASSLVTRRFPGTKIIILSMHNERSSIRGMITSGARGYLLKDSPARDIVASIRAVHAGETRFAPEVAEAIAKEALAGRGDFTDIQMNRLTPRETEVLVLIADGLSNKEIARRLGVAVRTVETHRERVMDKLDIRNVASLTRYAIQNGLVTVK